MTHWLKNYSPQRFLISFGLAAFVGSIISIISVPFVEGIAWINGKLLITLHARDGIEENPPRRVRRQLNLHRSKNALLCGGVNLRGSDAESVLGQAPSQGSLRVAVGKKES